MMPEQTFEQKRKFIIILGKVAHNYGLASIQIMSYLSRVTSFLGLKGEFQVAPNYINYILWERGGEQRFHFEVLEGSTFNMDKLGKITEMVDRVESGELSVDQGSEFLDDMSRQPLLYGKWLVGLGYVLSGAGFAAILGTSWPNILLGATLSLAVYFLVLLSGSSKWISYTLEFTSALAVSLLANILAIFIPGIDPFTSTLCGLIVLVPGLTLTIGLGELSSKLINSGMSRLIDGVMITLKLFLGGLIGSLIINAIWEVPDAITSDSVSGLLRLNFVILLIIGLALTFQVNPRDFVLTVLGGILAYAGTVVGGLLGFWQGSFIGAALLCFYAEMFAWKTGRPASIVLLTAIMVLVPGASAYLGLQAAEINGPLSGLTAEWHVVVNIMAIIGGLVLGYTLVPRKTKV